MYSTKTIHKNINPNHKQSYTSIGDPYRSSIEKLPERWKSKQFVTQRCPRNADNGFFSKLNYQEGDPYIEIAEHYSKTFPLDERKLGFGSRDAMKRGEFTSTKATERFRETLKQESKLMRAGQNDKENRGEGSKDVQQDQQKTLAIEPKTKDGKTLHLPKHMYDIGRSQVTPFCPHHQKDKFYYIPKHAPVESGGVDTIRRLGSLRPVSASIGEMAWKYTYVKPEYGRKK